MSSLRETLCDLIKNLSEENYDKFSTQYCFWSGVGIAYGHLDHDWVDREIQGIMRSDLLKPERGELIHPTAHLAFRLVEDMEDKIISWHASGYHEKHCARTVAGFFEANLSLMKNRRGLQQTRFLTDMNLIARWANLGFVREDAIRNHILQSLISHPKLYDHQVDALIILFKLAGATFGTYADPSALDRCFELLSRHYGFDSVKGNLVQEVVMLRECHWEGLPPPPVFPTQKPKPTGANKNESAATPVAAPLGLPNSGLELQTTQPPPPEPTPTPEVDTVPDSPIIQSPSISIATLSDFTLPGTSDDDSHVDLTAPAPHETFYLEDGNVEVLCGNALFRVHTSILSFHSPVLHRTFAQASLAAAESPNGCPRILSSDTATDFAILLKMIYLPGFPERNKVPDFATFSSLLRITAKYELPTVRSQLLEVVRDAYPETFEGLAPSKPLGESIFSGPAPHPNAVLNLFVQQKLVSTLPMAYYMAAQRGPDSLMDLRLPTSARLPPEILQAAIKGLIALREMELKQTHRLIFGSKTSQPCSSSNCPSRNAVGSKVSDAHEKVVGLITDASRPGTKLLQILSLSDVCGGDSHGFCGRCVEVWETGHAEVRKKAWAALPGVFGLKG